MQQRTTALFMLTSHLQDVREEERAALAQELHDELGALITVAKLDVSSLKQIIAALPEENDPQIQDKLLRLQENMVQIFAVKRGIIDRLFPSTLASLGIKDALNLMVQQFSTAAGIEVDLQIDDGIALPEKTELMLYRVTQEALNNISKYAEATQVQVLLSHNPSSQLVTLVIEDNGKGFAVDEVPSTTYGIKGMKHRAQALGAKWDIRSSRLGTRICIEVQGVAAS